MPCRVLHTNEDKRALINDVWGTSPLHTLLVTQQTCNGKVVCVKEKEKEKGNRGGEWEKKKRVRW